MTPTQTHGLRKVKRVLLGPVLATALMSFAAPAMASHQPRGHTDSGRPTTTTTTAAPSPSHRPRHFTQFGRKVG
jgi:hypothetical protein